MRVQCILRDCLRSFDRSYTYAVPADLCGSMHAGCQVMVPFGAGNRKVEAYVVSTASDDTAGEAAPVKEILSILSDGPVLRDDQIRLGAFMRERYYCTYGDALRVMVPARPSAGRSVRTAFLSNPTEAAEMLSEGSFSRIGQIHAVEMLLDGGETLVSDVLAACRISRSTLDTLLRMGVLAYGSVRDTTRRAPVETDPAEELDLPFEPTSEQRTAIESITALSIRSAETRNGELKEAVLFGVTGSGKTEVYLQCAQEVLRAGRTVLILVPEISLTPQMVTRIRGRFGNLAAVLHSRLTPRERYDQWRKVMDGAARVVVGARSAVFAPLEDIGLIVIDEEQESTYKSETMPRYHARTIARYRAIQHGSVLVLGSATPSIETFRRAETGRSRLLTLSRRTGGAAIPEAVVVDMRTELEAGNADIFSRPLRNALDEAFRNGQQAILFLNRRGYSGFLLCRGCGYVRRCLSCSVTMTLHRNPVGRQSLICHYCGRVEPVPDRCPKCGHDTFGRFGAGTQQVEELFLKAFPGRRVLRMDQDTTVGRVSHADILDRFARGESDVLIGTQMIAKGHDYPNVTVVGILSADLMLGVGDFRASERAFQLITQAAGRAGRGERNGRVFIQSYNTDDYAILAACAQDYRGFYEQEIVFRKNQGYPPFGVIGMVTVLSESASTAASTALETAKLLHSICESDSRLTTLTISEPARSPVYRIRNRYRWRLVIHAEREPQLSRLFLSVADRPMPANASLVMDIDPFSLS